MKILVTSQHYWPEPFPSTDLCETLAQRGHTVRVITDIPNYPMGIIYPEYRGRKRRQEQRNGVQISRVFTIGRRNNILFRFLNYYSFSLASACYARRLKEDYDVVLAVQSSPVMMVRGGLAYGKKNKKKTAFYIMDLWPACLAAGGVGENSPIYKLFYRVSKKFYGRADRLLITSRMFRGYLRENFDIPDEKIGYLPQYASGQFDKLPVAGQKDTVDLMFAGNVGAAQSLTTVLEAADMLREVEKLRFHIVGDGSELEHLQQIAQQKNLANVIFHGRKPPEEMPSYYAMADAMVVTLTADPFIGLTLPAKVQSYMAAGKPVIAAANGEIPQVIADAGCGYCAPAEDSTAFAQAVRQFLDSPQKHTLGQNARAYYEKHFTREQFMETLERELEALARQ